MKRRTVLSTVVTAGVATLAGCSGGGDDGSGNDTGNESTDGGPDEGGDGSESDGDETADPTLGESYEWTDSFVATMRLSGDEGPDELTMYYRGGDFRQVVEVNEESSGLYRVDGTFYQVTSGQCQALQEPDLQESALPFEISPQNETEIVGDRPDLTPSGRERIDGEEMYVYEYEDESETVTLYVSVDSRRIRRVQTADLQIDYSSWSEVDPIELPDRCDA